MWLTKVFLQRWPLVVVLIAFMVLGGIVSARGLIIQRLPETPICRPSVCAWNYSGASTTELRDTIVRPIEDQIAGSQDLTHVDSTIQTGSAIIASYFTLGSSSDEDLTQIIQAFNAAKSQLPGDLVTPVIRIFNPNAATVVSLGITSKALKPEAIASLAYGQIAPAIEQLGGVSNVLVAGNVQAAYNVTVDPNALAGYGLTLTDVFKHAEREQSARTGRHRVPTRPRNASRRPAATSRRRSASRNSRSSAASAERWAADRRPVSTARAPTRARSTAGRGRRRAS